MRILSILGIAVMLFSVSAFATEDLVSEAQVFYAKQDAQTLGSVAPKSTDATMCKFARIAGKGHDLSLDNIVESDDKIVTDKF